MFNWDRYGLDVLGEVNVGDAKIHFPIHNVGTYLSECLGTSTVIAILGFLVSFTVSFFLSDSVGLS